MDIAEAHPTTYLIDANVLIQAYQHYYSFDICPGFWDWLLHHGGQSQVLSIDRVEDEILSGDDALAEWITNHPDEFFMPTTDRSTQAVYRDIVAWIQREDYKDAAQDKFAKGADGWLVA